MMRRIAKFLTGLAVLVFAVADWIPDVPLPVNCQTLACTIGIDVIGVKIGVMLIALLLLWSAMRAGRVAN